MDVTPLIREGQQIIQNYAAGQFKVSGIIYDEAIIVTPDATIVWSNAPKVIEEISLGNFKNLINQANDIDILLLGTGAKMQFIPPNLRQELSESGLPIDVMDTGAACRTYNVLMAEGRRVVVAMLPNYCT